MFDEQPDGDPHGECAAEIHRLQEALRRLREWGGMNKKYSATISFGVTDWIDAGMVGELPELPDYARPNVEVTGAARLHRAASSDRRERGRPPGYAAGS